MAETSEARYLEDFSVGDRFPTGSMTVTQEAIVTFAQDYDPQPFHLDVDAAKLSVFGGLAASGWQTASMTMRLMVDSRYMGSTPMIGLGVDELKWPRPVRPGDTLSATIEILEIQPSRSNPSRGLVRIRTTTVNQDRETVFEMTSKALMPTRASALG